MCRCFFPLPADDGGSGKSLFQCSSLTWHIWASVKCAFFVPISAPAVNVFFNVPKKKNNRKNKI